MDLNSEEILDILTKENLKSKDVRIDFENKKIYITAIRENLDFLKTYMGGQGFDYVGETVKLQYDHNCCECKEPFNQDAPMADPVQCFIFSSSSESNSFQDDACSPFITLEKFAYQEEGRCEKDNVVLDLDTNCGCDTGGNCAWRTEIAPSWYAVTDTLTGNKYSKLVGGFSQLKVENGKYVFRELIETVYYPIIASEPTVYTQVQLNACPCLFENRTSSKFLQINVLENRFEDMDSLTKNWVYANATENYTFLHLENANNYCYANKDNLIEPKGNYVESDVLYNKWKLELEAEPNVHVVKIEEECNLSSSSSKSESSLSSNSSSSSFSSSSSLSSPSSESTSSSSSKSSDSSPSSTSSSFSLSSPSSFSSTSSSSSSYDERCVPKFFAGVENGYFGAASAFSTNGQYYAIGSPKSGTVNIYRIHTPNPPTGTPGFTLLQTLTSPLASSGFGSSVAFSGDSIVLVVGMPNYQNNKGAFSVYKKVGSEWLLVNTVVSPDGVGTSISEAYGDTFGKSVDVNSNGTFIAIGAPGHTVNPNLYGIEGGAVYVYNFDVVATITLDQKVYPLDGEQQDRFGWDVSLSDDGSKLLASAYDDDDGGTSTGSAYLFEKAASWVQLHKFLPSDGGSDDRFGWAVALAKTNDVVAISSYKNTNIQGTHAGAVYVYRLNGVDWVETKIVENDLISFSSFGFDIAMDACGETLCVGQLSYNYEWEVTDGANYTYEYNGSSWVLIHKFTDSYENGDLYGFSAAISRDGTYLSVGAPNYDTENGTCHVYKLSCFGRNNVCVPMNFASSSSQSNSSTSESSSSSNSSSSESSSSSSTSSSNSSSSLSNSSPSSQSFSSPLSNSSQSMDFPSDSSVSYTSVSDTSVSAGGGPTLPYTDCAECPQAVYDGPVTPVPDNQWNSYSYYYHLNTGNSPSFYTSDTNTSYFSGYFYYNNICLTNYTGDSYHNYSLNGVYIDLYTTYDGYNLSVQYDISVIPSEVIDPNWTEIQMVYGCTPSGEGALFTAGIDNFTGTDFDVYVNVYTST